MPLLLVPSARASRGHNCGERLQIKLKEDKSCSLLPRVMLVGRVHALGDAIDRVSARFPDLGVVIWLSK